MDLDDEYEFLVAISYLGTKLVMGVRGKHARDVAGDAAYGCGRAALPLASAVSLIGLPAGLYVYSGAGWPGAGEVRRAVLGDLQRFSLPPLLPRVEEATAC